MKRILVITNNLFQASFRLRMEVLVKPLEARGLHLEVRLRPRSLREQRKLLRTAGDYDAVILQRKLLGLFEMPLLARTARRIYFDVDDAVMYGPNDSGPLARFFAFRRFRALAPRVHHVVAGNSYLAELFTKYDARASILPTVVDLNHYAVRSHTPTAAPTLVWIGSDSTLKYLELLLPCLAEAARRIPGLKLLTIAGRPLSSSPLPTEHLRWSAQTEAEALCSADIGIAPTPRDRHTEGKCGFKIVQYMASGLPVIASPVGANAELVVHEKTGLLPETFADWPAAISRLALDAPLRAAMGAAGRRRAEEQFSLQRAVDFWANLLQTQ